MTLVWSGYLEVLKWFFFAILMIFVTSSSHYTTVMYIILKIIIGYYIYNINSLSLLGNSTKV